VAGYHGVVGYGGRCEGGNDGQWWLVLVVEWLKQGTKVVALLFYSS